MKDVFIGIGSNIGDRESHIRSAVNALDAILESKTVSSIYKTEPRDFFDQDFFLNIVVKGETALSPYELLEKMQNIENSGGRVRKSSIPKGPRTIDLDILLYGDSVLNTEHLTIPHGSMKFRRFVLIPLLELSPLVIDPVTGEHYFQYLEKIEEQGVYCSSLKHYNRCFV